MNIPKPPLIQSDSHVSKSKMMLLNTFSNLSLPIYSSIDDIIEPITGMLAFITSNSTLVVYNGTEWETINSNEGSWVQQGPDLVGTGYVGSNVQQGYSVALSTDGNTLAIGAPYDNDIGATWIFTRTAGVWTQQESKLVGTGAIGNANQGISVSLSADGNTLAVGGYSDNSGIGATWIFTRSAGVWTQQGSKIIGTGYVGIEILQGNSVSLSADGNTLAIGGSSDDNFIGATWIFTRTTGIWTQQGSKLVGSGYVGTDILQGWSVSLSADGNTLAIGGFLDDDGIGATWIFTRTAGIWTQQGSKLVGTGSTENAQQGRSVSLTSDGNTLAVGGTNDDEGVGATWVFTRSGGIWIQQGSKIVKTNPQSQQGTSVALSADGNTLAIGGPYDDRSQINSGGVGATWVFTKLAGMWVQQGSKLVGTGYIGTDVRQGQSVSLSSDGNTLAVGGFYDDSDEFIARFIGATWVFTRSAGVWTQQGSKLVGNYIGTNIQQGISVSLSSDGDTLAIGGPGDDDFKGATWIFTRSAGVWTQEEKLIGTGAIGSTPVHGISVSLSSDGDTLAVGSTGDDSGIGATWIFIRSVGVWSQQDKLVGTGYVGTEILQGSSVSLSADGDTLAVGSTGDDSGIGATWIFTRSGILWTQQGSKLVGSAADVQSTMGQGYSVSLSTDGNTLAIGGPYVAALEEENFIGGTWIFTRTAGIWTQQGPKLVVLDVVRGSNVPIQEGKSVVLSSDGNTLLFGAPGYYISSGGVWSFIRTAGVWSEETGPIVGLGATEEGITGQGIVSIKNNILTIGANLIAMIYTNLGVWTFQEYLFNNGKVDFFGSALALNSDKNTLAIGAPNNIGSTFVFIKNSV